MRVPLPVRVLPSVALQAWFTPPPAPRRASTVGDEFEEVTIAGMRSLQAGSGPLALLLHGWGGRPEQMAALGSHIAGAGFSVIAPELPGHAGGGRTDVKQGAAALLALIDETGMPAAVVAHSFGNVVARLAFVDEAPQLYVMIAPVLDVRDALAVFSERARLAPWTEKSLTRRLTAWDEQIWARIASLQPDQLPGAEVLIIHDPSDADAAFSKAAELAALRPATHIEAIYEAGHNGLLKSATTIDLVEKFLTASRVGGDTAA